MTTDKEIEVMVSALNILVHDIQSDDGVANSCIAQAANMIIGLSEQNTALQEENERLRGQLPNGMEHCTIVFKECAVGHGRLIAKNWVDGGCIMCKVQQAKEALALIDKCNNKDSLIKTNKRRCKGCQKDISHKHINAKFCTQKCKDKYWNTVNPRGMGVRVESGGYNPDDDFDPSWDSHKDTF